jgi:hypothetical protein
VSSSISVCLCYIRIAKLGAGVVMWTTVRETSAIFNERVCVLYSYCQIGSGGSDVGNCEGDECHLQKRLRGYLLGVSLQNNRNEENGVFN